MHYMYNLNSYNKQSQSLHILNLIPVLIPALEQVSLNAEDAASTL